jgi:flagellar biosynthesis repressor protein FlbT
MSLKIDLKPYERIIVGNVMMRNGDRRSTLFFESQAKFLREKDIITESQADTPCERLYVWIQALYLAGHSVELENAFMAQANEVMLAMPSTKQLVIDIHEKLNNEQFYPAIKAGHALIEYERNILSQVTIKSA